MKKYGLIGRKLGHSYSQRWFEELFSRLGLTEYHYGLYEMPTIENLHEWVKREGLSGFNVTVPFKRTIMAKLDGIDEEAKAVGAVNCVTVEGARLIGHNTDAQAFRETLEGGGSQEEIGERAFVLGTGGAAQAVAHALGQLGIPYTLVSRRPSTNGGRQEVTGYSQVIEELRRAATQGRRIMIVNATQVGMYPDVDKTPLDLTALSCSLSTFYIYDLTYNPSPTLLMRQAERLGAKTKDGLEMLERQAEASARKWKIEKISV